MISFDIITIFPEIFASYFSESIIKRARKKKLIKINVHNLRDYTTDRHRTVDDRPYGGGAGMILRADIILKAVRKIVNAKVGDRERRIVLFSAKGKPFNQKKAQEFAKKYKQIILISGRYEGVDERVARYIADEEISIGEYVLTGGELPAMVVVDAVSRLVPGVIKEKSLKEESFSAGGGEYPQYTRPEALEARKYVKNWRACPLKLKKTKVWRVPKILLSGNHKRIEEWKHRQSIEK
ncbi:MAG: tRNA (guanosine(37)-N1)-methyltransferase TrmD [Parcubacteria group bacterium CG08_land_8_20_14_0_20_43_9]|nr:MAG: tRNA (guanosine(37)-N1)-methyltransferase TrmD [Parcubacteria group bacterium CG08_land_8_20_14_0_20_43_9]